MSFAELPSLRKAFRRSRLRSGALLALLDLDEASLVDVAIELGADVVNVRGAFVGDGVRYRSEESLARLGLVAARARRGVLQYRLTPAGRRVAEFLRRERARIRRGGRLGALRAHST